jgi:hypothetical protein
MPNPERLTRIFKLLGIATSINHLLDEGNSLFLFFHLFARLVKRIPAYFYFSIIALLRAETGADTRFTGDAFIDQH